MRIGTTPPSEMGASLSSALSSAAHKSVHKLETTVVTVDAGKALDRILRIRIETRIPEESASLIASLLTLATQLVHDRAGRN